MSYKQSNPTLRRTGKRTTRKAMRKWKEIIEIRAKTNDRETKKKQNKRSMKARAGSLKI